MAVAVNVAQMQVLRPWSLQWGDAFAAAAHSLCTCRRCVCCGAVRHVSIGHVGAARGRSLRAQLVVETQGRRGPDCLRRTCALAVWIAACFVRGFRVQRAVAKKRSRALVALLLEPL